MVTSDPIVFLDSDLLIAMVDMKIREMKLRGQFYNAEGAEKILKIIIKQRDQRLLQQMPQAKVVEFIERHQEGAKA